MTVFDHLLHFNLYNHVSEKPLSGSLIDRNMLEPQKDEIHF